MFENYGMGLLSWAKSIFLKIDFENAYDQAEWLFIFVMLLVLYFGHFVCMSLRPFLVTNLHAYLLLKLYKRELGFLIYMKNDARYL